MKKSFEVIPKKYKDAFIGVKSFGFILNEEQWLQEMKYKATIDNYHVDNGDVTAYVVMLFPGWKECMKQLAVSKKEAKFAHKKQGWVSMSLNTSIIQTTEGRVIDEENSGKMFWPGRNHAAGGNSATQERILNFDNYYFGYFFLFLKFVLRYMTMA
jgi:hypothetical protein